MAQSAYKPVIQSVGDSSDERLPTSEIGNDTVANDAMLIFIQKLIAENQRLKQEVRYFKSTEKEDIQRISSTQSRCDANAADCRRKCDYCYDVHKVGVQYCNAYGKTCFKCRKDNHFAVTCRSKVSDSEISQETVNIHSLKVQDDSYTDEEMKAEKAFKGKQCRYCGDLHKWGSRFCPAYGKICRKCEKKNHIAKVCRSSNGSCRKYSADVNVTFTVNAMKERNKIILYDEMSKEFAIFPCSTNPTAREVGKKLQLFNHSLRLPKRVKLLFCQAGEKCCEQLASSLARYYQINVGVEKSQHRTLNDLLAGKAWRNISQSLNKNESRKENTRGNQYTKVCRGQNSAIEVGSRTEIDSEIQEIHVKINEIERKIYDIGFEMFREKENRNWEKCQVKSLESNSEDKELKKKYILDFANAILENSTCEISDLKTGKVWLELANGIYQKSYKAKANARKNYNAVLKMLQANGVDGYFIINHFDEILAGDEEANMNVAIEMEHILDYSENEVYMKEIDTKSGRYDEEDC